MGRLRNLRFHDLLKRKALVALVLGTAILGGTAVYAQAAKVTTTYRTALVTYGTITQTIGMAGNLTAATESDLNFASSGTVATVYVQVGQSVGVGAPLATLDTALLSAQLLQAQATLASAYAKLAQDRAGATAQNLTSAENSIGSAAVSVSNAETSLTDTKAINSQSVAAAEVPVTAAQAALTADEAVYDPIVAIDKSTLAADQLAMTAACSGPPSPTCTTATSVVAADEAKLTADEQPLVRDQTALESANSALAASKARAQQSNDQAASSLASTQQQYAATRSSLAALESSTSPQTIQMDDAQIQIDQVAADSLQGQVDGATLTAPIPGIVSQVNVKAGQTALAGGSSTSSAIVIFSPGSYDLTGTVSDSQVNLVAVGQTAEITPAGSTQAWLGKITSIAPAATVSSGVATFAVTAALTGTSSSLRPGTSASANIVINQVVHVLTVPTSAVHTTLAGSTVSVLVNGSPRTFSVVTGASDPTRTQIVSGLQLNQVVVIAVITSAVPSSGTGASVLGGRNRGGGGGFRGGPGG